MRNGCARHLEVRRNIARRHRSAPQQRQNFAPHRIAERLKTLLKPHYCPLFRAVNHVLRPQTGQYSCQSFPTCVRKTSRFHGRFCFVPQDLQIKSHLASAFACQITSIAAKISAIAQIRMVMSIPFTALLAILLIRWPSNCFQYTTVSAFVNTFR